MMQPKDELIRDTKISGIKKQVAYCINAAFSKGYDTCFEQKKEIEDRAYQKGFEKGRKQGVAIDGDKRYWDGYHAAQEDGKKIYQKGLEDAWSAARKLFSDMPEKEIEAIFPNEWNNGGFCALIELKPQEAIEKIREYEEKQKQEEAKERFREKLESGYFSGKQKQEGRSGYVSFVGEKPQEQGVSTVFPDSPCDLCVYNPPSAGDGKPCTMCPAEGREDEKCN